MTKKHIRKVSNEDTMHYNVRKHKVQPHSGLNTAQLCYIYLTEICLRIIWYLCFYSTQWGIVSTVPVFVKLKKKRKGRTRVRETIGFKFRVSLTVLISQSEGEKEVEGMFFPRIFIQAVSQGFGVSDKFSESGWRSWEGREKGRQNKRIVTGQEMVFITLTYIHTPKTFGIM